MVNESEVSRFSREHRGFYRSFGGMSVNGPRANFFTGYVPSGPAHNTPFYMPFLDDDFPSWDPYAAAEPAGVWGEMFQHPREGTNWCWRPKVPGIYEVQPSVQIGFNTTPSISTFLHMTTRRWPSYAYAGPDIIHGHPLGANNIDIAATYWVYATEEAINNNDVYVRTSAMWNRGASETVTDVSWYLTVLQWAPGADHNIYPEL